MEVYTRVGEQMPWQAYTFGASLTIDDSKLVNLMSKLRLDQSRRVPLCTGQEGKTTAFSPLGTPLCRPRSY